MVSIPVVRPVTSCLVRIAITISSRDVLPALSPRPFIVHSTCLAPPSTPARAFAVAMPRSLWQWTENITFSAPLTLYLTSSISSRISPGVVYPTVSGRLMVVAPLAIATSTTFLRNSGSLLVASSAENSMLEQYFFA